MSETPQTTEDKRGGFFISLRYKLLFAFTIIFLIALVIGFFWFSDFATNLAFEELSTQIEQAAQTTAADLNGSFAADQHLVFTREDMDEPLYNQMNLVLRRGKWNNPRASGVYTLRPSTDNPTDEVIYTVSATVVNPDEKTDRDLAVEDRTFDICQFDPDSRIPLGVVFSRADFPAIFIDTALDGFEDVSVTSEIYTDDFGTWLTAVAPFYDSDGNFAGAVAIDACAEDIVEIEEDIRNNLLIAFGGAFVLISFIVSLVSYGVTRPIAVLTDAADQIGAGNYDQDFDHMAQVRFGDEVTKLAAVFDIMVDRVAQREENLKKKVASLEIIIDQQKRDEEVENLTDNDFFREIQTRAAQLREERRTVEEDPQKSDDKSDDDKSEDSDDGSED